MSKDGKAGNSDPTLNICFKNIYIEESEAPPVLPVCIPAGSLGEGHSEMRTCNTSVAQQSGFFLQRSGGALPLSPKFGT